MKKFCIGCLRLMMKYHIGCLRLNTQVCLSVHVLCVCLFVCVCVCIYVCVSVISNEQ